MPQLGPTRRRAARDGSKHHHGYVVLVVTWGPFTMGPVRGPALANLQMEQGCGN